MIINDFVTNKINFLIVKGRKGKHFLLNDTKNIL